MGAVTVDAERPLGPGTLTTHVAPGIMLNCMDPEYRETLDRAMEEWAEHRKNLPPRCRRSIYSFAYWLIRWSGLVEPAKMDRP